MSGELKTQLVVGADVSGAVAGVETTKKKLATLGPAAVAAGKEAAAGLAAVGEGGKSSSAKVDAASKNMIGSIQRQIAVMESGSKSGADYYRALANQRGIDIAPLKPYLDQLDAVAAKQKVAQSVLQSTVPTMDRVGVSAKQTAAALRGVPAQFTDIVTSIQGGQAPLTVLLQQGGQLKDMFGGVGPAAKALGGYVAGLVNPFTLTAAAVAVLGLAYYDGSQRALEHSKALILSGNAAGKTTGELDEMARSVSASVGTQGKAADAINALVQSGRVASDVLGTVATAVVASNKVMGTSIKDSIEIYTKLAEEPAKASAKLNESLNYLNLATYQRIRTLEEQGHKEQAASVAQDALAVATTFRMKAIEAQAGSLAHALSVVSGAASGMWTTLANGVSSIGALKSASDALTEAKRVAEFLKTNGGSADAVRKNQQEIADASRRVLNEQNAAFAQGQRAADNAEKIAADERWQARRKANMTEAQIRKDLIAKTIADGKLLNKAQSEIDAEIANINEKHKDPKAAAFKDDGGTKYLETLRQQTAALQEQLTSAGKMTGAEREQAKFAQLIADLKGKTQLTAEQKGLVAAQDKIRAQLSINVGLEREVGFQKILADDTKRRADALKATENAMAGIGRSIELAAAQQREQYDDRLNVLGLGSQAAEQLQSREQIQRQYARFQKNLTDEAAKNRNLETAAYLEGTAKIEASLARALDANTNYYAALKERQLDWSLGAKQAFANYVDDSDNAFKQGERAASSALTGIEDMMVNLRKTGKLSFRSLGDSFIDELIRMETRAAVSSVYKAFGSGGAGSAVLGLLGAGASMAAGDVLGMSINGTYGSSTQAGLDALINSKLGSYDGGGYTGDGDRTGGVDGKGGFMAIMHPRETVTDHTKPQRQAWGAPTIINKTTGRVDRATVEQGPDGRPQITIEELAAQWDDPNSKFSKAYQRNYGASRKR